MDVDYITGSGVWVTSPLVMPSIRWGWWYLLVELEGLQSVSMHTWAGAQQTLISLPSLHQAMNLLTCFKMRNVKTLSLEWLMPMPQSPQAFQEWLLSVLHCALSPCLDPELGPFCCVFTEVLCSCWKGQKLLAQLLLLMLSSGGDDLTMFRQLICHSLINVYWCIIYSTMMILWPKITAGTGSSFVQNIWAQWAHWFHSSYWEGWTLWTKAQWMPTWKFVNPLRELAVPLGLSVMKME